MYELGVVAETIFSWFNDQTDGTTYTLIRVSLEDAEAFPEEICDAIRRAYISDEDLHRRAVELKQQLEGSEEKLQSQVISALLPDPSATMAGDFGEILFYIYQAIKELPRIAIGPKKWRLKQDRTKAAPKSDVVHFILPKWSVPSVEDEILCAEVKLKSQKSKFNPIQKAIEGSVSDRTSRLVDTLVWLKERAMLESLGQTDISKLNRFIQSDQYGKVKKQFRAVVIICSSLMEAELTNAPVEKTSDYSLVIISIPNLYKVYNDVYINAKATTLQGVL